MRSEPRTSRRRRRRHGIDPLLAVPALRDADPRRLAELAPHTDRLRLPPGRTLVRRGETARELIVIVTGEAAVHHDDGRAATLRAGAQIGGGEVAGSERHTATVVATSQVEVVVVRGPAVLWALREGLVRKFPRLSAGEAAEATAPAAPAHRTAARQPQLVS